MSLLKYVAILLVFFTLAVGVWIFRQSDPIDSSPGDQRITKPAPVRGRLTDWSAARNDAKVPIDPNHLETIERTIGVEPDYQGDERHYYCLIFDDDQSQMMWMVFDGSMLYVDCNFNGDLTDEGEAFPPKDDEGISLRSVEKISFQTVRGQDVSLEYTFPGFVMPGSDPNEYPVRILVNYRGGTFSAWGDETGEVANAKSAFDAPILRVNGPLQMGFEVPSNYAVKRLEDGGFEVNAGVGTYGYGQGSFMHLKYWNDAIPSNLFPEAELEFPSADMSKPNVLTKLKLKERC